MKQSIPLQLVIPSLLPLSPYLLLSLFLGFASLSVHGQVYGIVIDKEGPIIGANVFIEGSYDGTVTDTDGQFSFSTDLEGPQSLLISYLGYQSKTISAEISELKDLRIKLRESAATLDAVEISASTFRAGDNSKLAVLKPLDMVTTAGSMGDVIAAIQTLPGTQSNADDGRLFVRGGDATETKIFVDGLRVFSPYTRALRGTPSRGRFSPFLFKGVSFSTGGYDAEFGQALSGVLDMNTNDEPNETATNLSLMSIGMGVAHTQKGAKTSMSMSANYLDLTPYYWVAPTRLGLDKPYRAFSGEMVIRHQLGKGLLKTYVAGDRGSFAISRFNINSGGQEAIEITNQDVYVNSTYNSILSDKTSMMVGFSYGNNKDNLVVDTFNLVERVIGGHVKAKFKTVFSDFFIVNYGAELLNQENRINAALFDGSFKNTDAVSRWTPATFISGDYFFNKNLAMKLGLRYEQNSLLATNEIDPRITLAYKVGKNGQVSAAYGQYNQEVQPDALYTNTAIQNEKARHFLLNYNLKDDNKILRLEAYYKTYEDLLTFKEDFTFSNNEGYGTAYGFDVFWRTNKLIKYVDLWVSYSWLHNERLYRDYPTLATPGFSTEHNLSIVTKKWFDKLKSQLGVTYTMASGRPYHNPNEEGFMQNESGYFHNLSVSWSYLISQQKILFVSVSNAPGFRNEYGYRYADNPSPNGSYMSEQVLPNEDRFFFAGFFITMSADKTKNQLDQL